MLYRPLITCVLLILNVENTLAMKWPTRKSGTQNNVLNEQPAVVQNSPATAPGTPLHNPLSNGLSPQYQHVHNYPSPHMFPPKYQNAQVRPHLFEKINPPQNDPGISWAKCGKASYNKEDIIAARTEGCRNLPIYVNDLTTRKAVYYYPKVADKYIGDPPYFLYPLGRPIFKTRASRHYGFDRVVLNQWCQVVGILTEVPKMAELLTKTEKLVMGRPLQNYDQRRYSYLDCKIS